MAFTAFSIEECPLSLSRPVQRSMAPSGDSGQQPQTGTTTLAVCLLWFHPSSAPPAPGTAGKRPHLPLTAKDTSFVCNMLLPTALRLPPGPVPVPRTQLVSGMRTDLLHTCTGALRIVPSLHSPCPCLGTRSLSTFADSTGVLSQQERHGATMSENKDRGQVPFPPPGRGHLHAQAWCQPLSSP